ncbi:MAG: hypothetical protein JO209_08420 [Acidisphaera sp.]|nr:hypothetical protein [Acidisphaera sp.]
MKTLLTAGTLAIALSLGAAGAQAAGCLSGAAVGAGVGHFVGHGHALAGGAVGCAVGLHEKHVAERNAARGNAYGTPSPGGPQINGQPPSNGDTSHE